MPNRKTERPTAEQTTETTETERETPAVYLATKKETVGLAMEVRRKVQETRDIYGEEADGDDTEMQARSNRPSRGNAAKHEQREGEASCSLKSSPATQG